MKQIRLPHGIFTTISNEDFNWVCLVNWHITKDGYVARTINNKKVFLHNLIVKTPKGKTCDHKNGNPLDNRRSNLRIATYSENLMNSKLRKDSTSGYKGVSFNKSKNKWEAYICFNKKRYYLGVYESSKEAGKAYDKKALEISNNFSRLNFSQGGES